MFLGPARLHPEEQSLTIGSRRVMLQRKPYLVLQYLIENRDRMILRKELLDRFWDGQEVYDESLSKAVGSIRKAFGETRDGSVFIETRWGIGYRYVGPFGEAPASSPNPADRLNGSLRAEAFNGVPDLAPSPAVDGAGLAVPPPTPENLVPRARTAWRQWPAFALLASLILTVGAAATLLSRPNSSLDKAPDVPAAIRSVAVLPFTANTGNEDDQILGMGLADAVAAKLGAVSQLRVRSSATIRSILGSQPDPALAGRKLQVQTVVRGDIHRVQNRFVITVRLLDSPKGADVWSGAFIADDSNIIATEDSIAQQVAAALLPASSMNGVRPSSGPDTKNPQAYAKYMKAEFFAGMRTQNALGKAIDLLNEVLLIDPKYARAYAALADCYQLQGFYQFVPPAEAYPRAKAAALKALSMDNSLIEAHVSLLSTLTDYDWDWEGAEREFKAAAAIDPNYAVAYQYYGYALLGMGRGDEALAAMKHAAELDPVSPSVQTSLAWGFYLLRQDEQAVDQCKRVLELYPDFVPAHQLLGIVYGQMRLDQRSMAELSQAETLERDSSVTPILLDYEQARSGKKAEAGKDLINLVAKSRGASIPDYYLAAAWIALGDKEKAQASLQRAYETHSNWVIYLQYDPRFDDLRPDPRFQALLHRVAFSRNDSHSAQS